LCKDTPIDGTFLSGQNFLIKAPKKFPKNLNQDSDKETKNTVARRPAVLIANEQTKQNPIIYPRVVQQQKTFNFLQRG
jgi:hypothetical protein